MNILYLCDEYPPGQHGGIGTLVQLLAREMVKQGHKVVVAGLYSPGYGGNDKFDDEGVNVYRFRRMFDIKRVTNQQSLIFKAANRVLKDVGLMEWDIKRSLRLYQQRLENIIIQYKIDIVEMPDYNDYVRFCKTYIPFPKLSVPVVVKLNGSITYFNTEAGKPTPAHLVKMEQAILNQAAAVSSASKYTAQKSATCLSYSNKVEVLYNGINTNISIVNKNKNPKQVIFTGTLVTKKGIYQLAKAWNIVIQNMPDARLLVLGKGDQQKVIELLSPAAIKTATFMGHVATAQLYQHLSNSAVSVFPSYSEAFALAPLEAMACGTAVINPTRTSGPELITDNVNGLLIDPDNITQIADAILLLLNDQQLCATLAKKGNETVKELFDISKVAEQNFRFYEGVLSRAD